MVESPGQSHFEKAACSIAGNWAFEASSVFCVIFGLLETLRKQIVEQLASKVKVPV